MDGALPDFPSRATLKLHNISLTPKLVKRVITTFDLSKGSGRHCTPVVILKTCRQDLSYMLAELFNMCTKESCFPEGWKV